LTDRVKIATIINAAKVVSQFKYLRRSKKFAPEGAGRISPFLQRMYP
jgi:hypothetical protein